MKKTVLWCCMTLPALGLAAEAADAPAAAPLAMPGTSAALARPLVHDGYRLLELKAGPPARNWRPAGGAPGCGAIPAVPAATPGELAVVPLVKDRFFNKFFQGGGRLYRLVSQQKGVPQAVVLRSGTWTLPRLAERLAGEPGALQRKGQAYLLRLPLLVQAGAGVVVGKGETLRLSKERGSFVLSLGSLFVSDGRLEGWDETRGAISEVAADGSVFQPFVVGWSGSQTVFRGSTVAGLGFAENLAKGVTLAQGPLGLDGYDLPAPPRLLAQDSRFEGMYSAIHATAIPDVRLCRNLFQASRLHAIHLDEGSSGLLLHNRVADTWGPYGLYFNKDVRDVQVLENVISENRRSGISITDSEDIVLAGNEIRQNFDAVFLQNTDRILFSDNHILDNQRHGVTMRNVGRIRMQRDQIGPNRGVGVITQTAGKPAGTMAGITEGAAAGAPSAAASPRATPAVPALPAISAAPATAGDAAPTVGAVRQVAFAPVRAAPARASTEQRLELLGVVLEGNHSSAMVVDRPYTVLLDNVDVLYPGVRRRPVFRGVLNTFEADILQRLTRRNILLVEPTTSPRPGSSRSRSGSPSPRTVPQADRTRQE
ncbi:MAG TPA: right-handed parallel beta-helix repeat-containing protein [Moraxellaceae bacterium]|nr:right-handed parallel beta-helix repeat-containing protein [Moraxellaceae bacterium]